MKKKLFALALVVASCVNAFPQATSLTIDCQTPGWLSSMINYGDQQTVKNLKVTGYINSTDLKFLGTLIKSRNLQGCLDLTEANVVGENGKADNTLEYDCFGIDKAKNIKIQTLKFPNSIVSSNQALVTYGGVLFVDSLYWNVNNVKGYDFVNAKQFCNNLILGENVTSIPGYAFENGYKFKNVFLSKNTSSIGEKAFFGCEMETANINELQNLAHIGEKAFRNSSPSYVPFSQDTLVVPNKLADFNTNNFNFRDHEHIFISSGTTMLSSGVMGKGLWVTGSGRELLPDTLFFHMESRTPPILSFSMSSNYVVYVPMGAKSAYSNDSKWSKATIIEVANPMKEISINEKRISLEKGNTYQLFATPIPANADDTTILWYSDNHEVVTVNETGLITAITSGVANIIAMSSDKLIRDTCIVTVNAHAENVSLSSESITFLNIGDTCKLVASVLPDNAIEKSVIWKSFNELVCLVSDNGLITAVDYGTGIITATTVDGGHTAVCTVKVVHPCDVNCDGKVDVADIATIISVMAGSDNSSARSVDVNNDGHADVADIATIIDEMAAQARRQEVTEE